jgi:hypothetical protein
MQTVSVMEGKHACWFDDGRLQPIDDYALSDAEQTSVMGMRARSGTMGPPSYNDVVRQDVEGRAPAGSFRGAWASEGAVYNLPPDNALARRRMAEPIAGCVLPLLPLPHH